MHFKLHLIFLINVTNLDTVLDKVTSYGSNTITDCSCFPSIINDFSATNLDLRL